VKEENDRAAYHLIGQRRRGDAIAPLEQRGRARPFHRTICSASAQAASYAELAARPAWRSLYPHPSLGVREYHGMRAPGEALGEIVPRRGIVVACAGVPRLITADMVQEGAVVIDVGINATEDGIVGDVDFAAVREKAALITPVPGGVGPMTVTMIMENTVKAAERLSWG
jgi:hypothetical protein